ncbi:MAG: ABC transporter ATP-binding protein/permease [Defluviitaleaceae bacterium]|nr:ABC transporter ATP-binding protein/permease [Defluviitaleaceae bacterium]
MKLIEIMKFIRPFFKDNKKNLAIFIVSMVIAWSIGIVMPLVSGIYIDYLVSDINVKIIVTFVIIVAIINIIDIINAGFSSVYSSVFNNKFLFNMGINVTEQVIKLSLSKHKKIDRGELLSQIIKDTQSLVIFFSNSIVDVILHTITIVVSSIIIFTADTLLSFTTFLLIPTYFLIYFTMKKRVYQAEMEWRASGDEYSSRRLEQISKIEFIKINSVLDEMQARYKNSFLRMEKAAINSAKADYIFENSGKFVATICQIIVIGLGGYRVYQGSLSIGFFTMINIYFSMIISSSKVFLGIANNYQGAKISVERLQRLYKYIPEKNQKITFLELNNIKLKDLSMKYDNSEDFIFKNLNYIFSKGNIYSLTGDNGSGKSTLLNCIIGLYDDLYSGNILFNDINISKIDMENLRRNKISFSSQSPEFLNLTIEEYLSFGINMTEDIIKFQSLLLELFELKKFNASTKINENGGNFSGGEKQKLAIIRSLSKQSFLIILDEPTNTLDIASVNTLIKILLEQKKDKIIIITSHDKRILDICDENINLSNI